MLTFISLICLALGPEKDACGQSVITVPYAKPIPNPLPDYALTSTWAALPEVADAADRVPLRSDFEDQQASARADVFFIYPTTYVQSPDGRFPWNASLADSALNLATDESTILNQASVFNGSCRVYAPRYRQAHFYAFLTPNNDDKVQALNFAYADVRTAFEYYLQHYNQGRPIVIAAHSQGTLHAVRLMKEFFDNKPLGDQLVVAYLIGMPVQPDEFRTIPPGGAPGQTRCFVSWRTFAKNYYPDWYQKEVNTAVCTNPLSWKTDDAYVSQKENLGGVGLKYTYYPQLADAQCHEGLLWISKPYIKGRAFISNKNWHNADINLFWANVRQNVQTRIDAFISKEKQ
ncbi:DUF3089 domain-containing protein [Persicitalea jodogahamensis]|uniref:DUF3089 domain-containing protein n=1 Tax=Persicitalea jodogahamensis TaxID=402147 RepID=UPI00167B6B59|nr:DUF3089 domain-containing protein [Persicitalea jodogahamensis]